MELSGPLNHITPFLPPSLLCPLQVLPFCGIAGLGKLTALSSPSLFLCFINEVLTKNKGYMV